ncbi:hypothetical protein BDV19DRAFT_372404 [Aspergillus venezuelensis]
MSCLVFLSWLMQSAFIVHPVLTSSHRKFLSCLVPFPGHGRGLHVRRSLCVVFVSELILEHVSVNESLFASGQSHLSRAHKHFSFISHFLSKSLPLSTRPDSVFFPFPFLSLEPYLIHHPPST